MKMISTPAAVAANQYPAYVHDCLRNAACEPSFAAPLPSLSALEFFVDFGADNPSGVEFTLIDYCNNTTEQITPAEYIIGQTPEENYYGVFKAFGNPAGNVSTFIVHLSATTGGGEKTFFSQMLVIDNCGPLTKIKSCHPQAATTTGFDVNGVYYGLPTGGFVGFAGVRYFHIAYVRLGKVREVSNKAVFKSGLYTNFRTTVEKNHVFELEIVPKWFKDVLLAIYSRGIISVNDGANYIVSDLAFEPVADDDLRWKAFAQLKETFRLVYGCDDGLCEECCEPSVLAADAEPGGEDPSESEPPTCCSPAIISATAEPLDDSASGSASDSTSDSGSEPPPEPPEGALRLLFDDIANAETLIGGSASDVTLWEAFIVASFSSVVVIGNEVYLLAPPGSVVIAPIIFSGYANLIHVIDEGLIVVTVDTQAFYSCSALVEVDLPAVTQMFTGAFTACASLETVNIPLLFNIAVDVFAVCPVLTTLNCPDITSIQSTGLGGCYSLPIVDFPDCLSVGYAGCSSMQALITVNLPNVITVGEDGFSFCDILTTISLPNATTFGDMAFRNCPLLTTIYLPSCTNLGTTTGDDNVFQNIVGNNITLTIPTALATDGDVVTLQANNTVTLILV